MRKPPQIPVIPDNEQTPTVKALLLLLERFAQRIVEQDEKIAQLEDEVSILKGEKKRPIFKPSKMDQSTDPKSGDNAAAGSGKKKRAGSKKRSKNATLTIHETVVVKPEGEIPCDSRFKGYRDFVVQDLVISSRNTVYRLERWQTPQGPVTAELPSVLQGRHFGPELIRFVLYQHHHCQTTQPLLLEQLREYGVDISSGQIEYILSHGHEKLHAEKDALLQAGLESSSYVTVDDSGARHKGKNGFVTHIGNAFFGWFKSTPSKSRVNFLSLLCAGVEQYVLNEQAMAYMRRQKLPQEQIDKLLPHLGVGFTGKAPWHAFLSRLAITGKRHRQVATEGALHGCVLSHGFCQDLVVVSDGARQFDVLHHALCWVHAERLVHKTLALNEVHRQEVALVREGIWTLYADLKAYKLDPQEGEKERLSEQFDAVFTQRGSFETLNQQLKRIHRSKSDLLRVLEHPDIPLHTNGSETDIRDYVKKKKVSGGTRSDEGQRCRDTFASLKKTCRKLGISFWAFLGDRLRSPEQSIPSLAELVRERAAAPTY